MSFIRTITMGAILFAAGIGSSYGGIYSAAGTWLIGPQHEMFVSPKNVIAILVLKKDSTLTYQHSQVTYTLRGKWERTRSGGITIKINPGTKQEVIYKANHLPNNHLLINMGGQSVNAIERTSQFQNITIENIRAAQKK